MGARNLFFAVEWLAVVGFVGKHPHGLLHPRPAFGVRQIRREGPALQRPVVRLPVRVPEGTVKGPRGIGMSVFRRRRTRQEQDQ